MDVNRFQKDKAIDPNQLDMECVLQPERFFYWAEQAAEASAEVERAKLHLDVVKAQLETDCRKNPDEFGVAKVTESAIAAAVEIHSKYEQARRAYIDARRDSKLLDAAVSAMEQKKRMLEVLITLHGQNYFAGPSVPHDLGATYMEHRADVESSVRDRQKFRTRKRGRSK